MFKTSHTLWDFSAVARFSWWIQHQPIERIYIHGKQKRVSRGWRLICLLWELFGYYTRTWLPLWVFCGRYEISCWVPQCNNFFLFLCTNSPHSLEKGHLTNHSMLDLAWKNSKLQLWKRQLLRSYFFSSITVIAVGEPHECEEGVLGDTSNPISVNNSLGAKAGVVCSCSCCGCCCCVAWGAISILSFLSFLCFLCFFLSLPLGMSSTIFCKESIGE